MATPGFLLPYERDPSTEGESNYRAQEDYNYSSNSAQISSSFDPVENLPRFISQPYFSDVNTMHENQGLYNYSDQTEQLYSLSHLWTSPMNEYARVSKQYSTWPSPNSSLTSIDNILNDNSDQVDYGQAQQQLPIFSWNNELEYKQCSIESSNRPTLPDPKPRRSRWSKLSEGTLCLICPSLATARNFGAPSCDSCKNFYFRRVIQLHDALTEHKDQEFLKFFQYCHSKCRPCRLKKCIGAGMLPFSVSVIEDKSKLHEIHNIFRSFYYMGKDYVIDLWQRSLSPIP